jgi:hypothetical protein
VLDLMSTELDFSQLPWRFEKFELRGGGVTAVGAGTFDPLEGRVDLRFAAELDDESSRKYVERYSLLKKLVNAEGRIELPLKIRGPLLGPEFDVDVDRLLSGSRDADEPKDALKGLLKGLVEKKLSKKKDR